MANEKSTIIILLSFKDEDNQALTVGDLISPTWSLTDGSGNYVNNRQNITLTDNYVVLTGDDLAIADTNMLKRILTIEAQYNSSTYGNNLYLRKQYQFSISNLIKVT